MESIASGAGLRQTSRTLGLTQRCTELKFRKIARHLRRLNLNLRAQLPEGSVLISYLYPVTHLDLVKTLKDARVTAFVMDLVPRITRAQSMDALSSMSTVSGYRAALLAARSLQSRRSGPG